MQAEFKENLVKNLPDAYKKTTDSNNFKILEVERKSLEEVRKSLWGYDKCEKCGNETITQQNQNCPVCGSKTVRINGINDILYIDNAKGKTLDLYGERVGQARGLANDEKYLLMIKAKIMRNLSNGSYPSILTALCQTFNCEPSQIFITDGEEPCTVNIVTLPLDVINKAGLSTNETVAIVKSLLPAGVTLSTFLFEGTFEFAATENEIDETKGFSDVGAFATDENYDDVIGGYFGATQGDETDIILPI